MRTTPALDLAIASLQPIEPAWLVGVTGGCHKQCCPPPQPQPEAAPAPAPSGGPLVQTSVQVNYGGQPAQPQTTYA